MDIGHGKGIADDAGEVRDVHDLPQAVVLLKVGDQFFTGIDTAGHSHAAPSRNFPETFFKAIESYFFSGHGTILIARREDMRPLDIEDHPRMPRSGFLPDAKVMI